MSIRDLATLAGVPGLDLGITLLTGVFASLENIKIYRQQCSDMSGRCVSLMVAPRDGSVSLEGTKAIEFIDEVTMIVRRVDRKVSEWAAFDRLKSFLLQREIRDGIDRLHRDIDAAAIKFNIKTELAQSYRESITVQERDKAEIREVLQTIVKSVDDRKALLNMPAQSIEDLMESLQIELHNPELKPIQEQTFKEGLWLLHEKTSKLPPLTDLTGQITLSRNHAIAKNTFEDIFLGEWLEHELVVMRLPRTLTSNSEVQKRFQREVTFWRSLNHPNVVPLYGIAYIREDLYSVSPWMDCDNAISYVKVHPMTDRLRPLSDIASGLEYLHTHGIVHGDLRGANILISSEGVAKLSDFGLAKFLEDCGLGMTSSPGINLRWLAPELLRQTALLSIYSDVWSFAMVCLELITGEQPFSSIGRDIAVMRELDQGKHPERPGRHTAAQGFNEDLWTLMKKCWNRKPESRPSISYVNAQLSEMRGPLSSPGALSPTKRRSIFSFHRLSTGSDTSIRPLKSENSPKTSHSPPVESQITEAVPLSPVSSSACEHSLSVNSDPRNKHPSEATDSKISYEKPKKSGSKIESGQLLEVPQTLTPLVSQVGGIFPLRTPSSEGQPSPKQSVISSNFDVQLTSTLREAVTDPRPIVNFDRSGSISSGTLEGLVEMLVINRFNLKKDLEYREILLTCYTDFTTPEKLFEILTNKFQEAEDTTTEHPEDKVAVQYNIFMVITHWLTSPHLVVDSQLLWQMRDFCMEATSMKSSTVMHDKARDIMRLIEDYENKGGPHLTLPLLPGQKIPRTSEILPRDLAIALTLLEGDKYKRILPADYIAHLRTQSKPNNVEAAYLVNNRIVLWIKQSILHYDAIEPRVQVLKFFVNTAQECRKYRNFSSLTAIAHALHSAPIDRLRLTKKELPLALRHILEELDDILDPSANHRTYRAALRETTNNEYKYSCVPWVAVHLRELHSTLQKYPTVVEVNGRSLINFERYIKFTDRIKEVLHYVPPDLEQYRQQGQLAYLEHQLRGVELKSNIDEELMERSLQLEAGETRDYRARKRELRKLGFRSP